MLLIFIAAFGDGLARFLRILIGIFGMVSLSVTIIHVLNGDREAAKKMFKWLIGCVVGFVLISVLAPFVTF